ncbi:MAG: RNA methyltransferase [Clostridia bacterium]|nr:RNA methyltransferase [Clostridia bacterium]
MKFIDEIITSRNNATVKWAASLKDKKGRDCEKMFLAEGEKLTYEALSAGLPVAKIFVNEAKADRILPKLKELVRDGKGDDSEVQVVADGVFSKISTENAPQGVISVIKHLDFFRQMDIIYKEEFSKNACGRSIVLCSVRDPGNLGSAIRSAVAFGVEHIVLSSDCADIYNPKTVRGAMGSLFRVKVTRVSDLKKYIEAMRSNGRRVYSAELSETAKPLGEINITKWDAVIIGNEGHGVPRDISEASDGGIYIPISSKTESLNASVAAAIFMWEQSKII